MRLTKIGRSRNYRENKRHPYWKISTTVFIDNDKQKNKKNPLKSIETFFKISASL